LNWCCRALAIQATNLLPLIVGLWETEFALFTSIGQFGFDPVGVQIDDEDGPEGICEMSSATWPIVSSQLPALLH